MPEGPTHTVGGSAAEQVTLVADHNFHNGRVPDGVSFKTAYLALHYVAEQAVPVSCDAIYGRTNVDILRNEYGELEFMEAIRKGEAAVERLPRHRCRAQGGHSATPDSEEGGQPQ